MNIHGANDTSIAGVDDLRLERRRGNCDSPVEGNAYAVE